MKKLITILLAVVLSLGLALMAAADLTGCTVTADAVRGSAGGTVTVAVRVTDNPGFTNFAVRLDYDRENLTLIAMEPGPVGTAAVNPDRQEPVCVAASAEAVKGDCVLFTATFEVAADFAGTAAVTPVVEYIRSSEAVLTVFEQLQAAVIPGSVTSVVAGDVNGDGVVEYDDVMLAYRAFLGRAELTIQQLTVVDTNQNGAVEQAEYEAVCEIYTGG